MIITTEKVLKDLQKISLTSKELYKNLQLELLENTYNIFDICTKVNQGLQHRELQFKSKGLFFERTKKILEHYKILKYEKPINIYSEKAELVGFECDYTGEAPLLNTIYILQEISEDGKEIKTKDSSQWIKYLSPYEYIEILKNETGFKFPERSDIETLTDRLSILNIKTALIPIINEYFIKSTGLILLIDIIINDFKNSDNPRKQEIGTLIYEKYMNPNNNATRKELIEQFQNEKKYHHLLNEGIYILAKILYGIIGADNQNVAPVIAL